MCDFSAVQVQVTESSQVEALSGTEPEIPKVASTPLSRQEEATAAAPGGVAPVEGSCGPPPRLNFAELIDEHKGNISFPVGWSVTYMCRQGYYGRRMSVTCLESLIWSEAQTFCTKKSCGNPGEPANGHLIVPEDIHFGSTVNFTCDEGHRLIGPSSIRCIVSGQRVAWTDEIPLCQRISCSPPPDIQHGKHSGRNDQVYYYGNAVTYTCDKGYPHVGDDFIHCTTKDGENGVWSGHVSCGVTLCPAPRIEKGSIVAGSSGIYKYKHKVTLGCSAGHVLTGLREIYCQADGTWDPPVPLCEHVVQCPSPPKVLHGKYSALQSAIYTNGKSIKYYCEPGYVLIGEATIYCTASGTWSLPIPRCEVKGCVGPEIQNGRKSSSKLLFKPMEKVIFECDRGYILKGNTTVQCQQDSTWDLPVPLCIRVMQCHKPPQVQNGFHSNQESALFNHGMSVKYTCEHGYTLIGEATIYCTESGTWTLPAPHCEVLQCSPPPSISNGEHNGSRLADFPAGTYVNYTCNPGYLLVGDASSHCTPSGAWSQPIPQCEVMRCPVPPGIAHGSYFGTNFTYQMSVFYVCDAGFSLVGDPMVTCTLQGSDSANWSEPPQCKGCLAPQEIANGKPDTEVLEDFAYGSSVTYHCDPGFVLTGATTIYCLSYGMWDPPVPQCKATGCILPQISGGKKTALENMFQSGDNVTVQCEDGYVLEGSPYIQCQPNFAWNPPVPICKAGFYHMASISFGSLVGFLLFLAISGIIWMAISKRNKARYTPANSREISDSSSGRV